MYWISIQNSIILLYAGVNKCSFSYLVLCKALTLVSFLFSLVYQCFINYAKYNKHERKKSNLTLESLYVMYRVETFYHLKSLNFIIKLFGIFIAD